jgi:hypothetical protein
VGRPIGGAIESGGRAVVAPSDCPVWPGMVGIGGMPLSQELRKLPVAVIERILLSRVATSMKGRSGSWRTP